IDYARGICIILVGYRHCFEGLREGGFPTYDYPFLQVLNVCFFSFRMPLFFIISGLFLSLSISKKGLGNFIWNRFRIVFYPLIIWGFIQITIQLILKDYVNARREPIDYLNLFVFPRKIEQFWYLNALFMVGVFYAFNRVVLKFKYWHQLIAGFVLYSIAAYLYYNDMVLSFIPDVFHYYLYFCIGDGIASFILNKNKEAVITAPKWIILSLVVFIMTQSFFTVTNLWMKDDIWVSKHLPYLFLLISLSGCIFVIQLSFILQKLGIVRWLRVIGYHSLYIYLVHLIVIAGVRVVLVRLFHIDNIPVILAIGITAGIIIPVLLYNICVRLGWWWLFTLKKPVDEISHFSEKRLVA
ncbi:MAG: acyltransferase, partial [Gemmatimonadaceae bacterium]|nr:acyltransferase [Chitinophagaceae bacterium]